MNHATRRPSSSVIVGRWAPFSRIPYWIPKASKASKSPRSLNSRSKTSGWPPRRSFTCRNSRGCSRLREWRPWWIRVADKGKGNRPTGIGQTPHQKPEAQGLAVGKPVPIAGPPGIGPFHLGHIPDGERRLFIQEAQKDLLRIGLLQKSLDRLVICIGTCPTHGLSQIRNPQRTGFQDRLDQPGGLLRMLVPLKDLGHDSYLPRRGFPLILPPPVRTSLRRSEVSC
jgi:hypothetical protein